MNKKKLIILKNKYRVYIYLSLIIIIAFYFRTLNLNWDNGYYFHPDERAIVMFANPLHLPRNISDFLKVDSPLNPHFFAYGSLPIYLVKMLGESSSYFDPLYKEYSKLYIVGRVVSASADTGTVFFVFLIASAIFSKRAGLFGALLYALSVFPIQTSHFYTVDPLLTFFVSAMFFSVISFIRKPTYLKSLFVGMVLGLALATKVSAAIFILDILLAIILVVKKKNLRKNIRTALYAMFIALSAFIVFIATQPYVLIDFNTFLSQTRIQSQMSSNAFLFPYTLQYVGKIPYLYELKNLFLWGMGPFVATLSLMGIPATFSIFHRANIQQKKLYLFLLFTTLSYFFVFGKFAVGWMRYMLPIYPLLTVFGGFLVSEKLIPIIEKKHLRNYFIRKITLLIFVSILLIYPLSFLSIYIHPNTKIQATEWINKNIPFGSSLAVEHWDDALPVYGGQNYIQLTLPLYEPDTSQKWQNINAVLKNSDYIIIASNRLYKPLQKLTDCNVLPKERCYPQTADYYKKLFSGRLGFRKIVEFSTYPTIPFTNIKLVDDGADESFTVYDHPKIMIFKKID